MLKITFEFVGGPNDGVSLEGTLGDASDAERYYLFTNHGTVGQRFKVASEYAVETLAQETLQEERRHYFQPHYYVVTDHLAENNEVLVRAEYVEKREEKDSAALIREHLEPSPTEAPSSVAKIQRLLRLTAESLAESYSHCWPAHADGPKRPAECHICLHLAHVLLSEKFTVFAAAVHPDATQEDIDLVGIAPSQDWFLACQTNQLVDSRSLQKWLPEVQRLESFWLNDGLTIEACSEHIQRLAKHCHAGYGLAVGGHWVVEAGTELLDYWSKRSAKVRRGDEFAEKLAELGAEWYEPMAVRQYEGRGTFYLLGATFRIPR